MLTSIKVEARVTCGGCGIYELGHEESSLRAFVTNRGRAIAIDRIITADDLMKAYEWGRTEANEDAQDEIRNKEVPFIVAEVIADDHEIP